MPSHRRRSQGNRHYLIRPSAPSLEAIDALCLKGTQTDDSAQPSPVPSTNPIGRLVPSETAGERRQLTEVFCGPGGFDGAQRKSLTLKNYDAYRPDISRVQAPPLVGKGPAATAQGIEKAFLDWHTGRILTRCRMEARKCTRPRISWKPLHPGLTGRAPRLSNSELSRRQRPGVWNAVLAERKPSPVEGLRRSRLSCQTKRPRPP
jgi:hypothetical protein